VAVERQLNGVEKAKSTEIGFLVGSIVREIAEATKVMKKADQKPEKEFFTESNNKEPEIVREKSTHDELGSEVSPGDTKALD
jgi:hypothetical protein